MFFFKLLQQTGHELTRSYEQAYQISAPILLEASQGQNTRNTSPQGPRKVLKAFYNILNLVN